MLAFILVQIQVLLVGAPVIFILNESNPSARYVGLSLLTFSFPMSAMGLIILPKAMIVRRRRRKGGEKTASSTQRESLQGGEEIEAIRSTEPVVTRSVEFGMQQASNVSVAGIKPRMQVVTWE